MKEVAGVGGSVRLLWAVAWSFLAALISLFTEKKGERSRDIFASVAMITGATGMPCFYSGSGFAAFLWAGFCKMGIWLKTDRFRWLYSITTTFMWMTITLFSMEYFAYHGDSGRYCFLSLLTCRAIMGVFPSDSLFTLFLFLEIMGLTLFVIAIQEETVAVGRAARTCLVITVIERLCVLFDILMIVVGIGNLSTDNLEQFRKTTGEARLLYLVGALLLTGFGAKAGMYPLHAWPPNTHPVVSAPVSALLSGILTKIGVFGTPMVTMTMFQYDKVWGMVPLAPEVMTMVLGTILAVLFTNLKRILACPPMFQTSLTLMGYSMQRLLGEENGLVMNGTVLHMVDHSMIKLVPFMATGYICMDLRKPDLDEIRGCGKNKPFLMLVFVMGAYGIYDASLWNGYVGKALLHESITEYMEMLGRQSANALPFQVLKWAFPMMGGSTAVYMIKLLTAIFLEEAPLGQDEGDRGKKYVDMAACLALGGSVLLLPLMGMALRRIMGWMTDISRSSFREAHALYQMKYFSEANLRGARISISMGIPVYVLSTHRYLMEAGEDETRIYADRWSAWLNLEDRVYHPLVFIVLPFLGAVLTRCVSGVYEVPPSPFVEKPEKNQAVVPGESSRFLRQVQDVRLLHMIYSSMEHGSMMSGVGPILMTAYMLSL